jgi:hypothetical protein
MSSSSPAEILEDIAGAFPAVPGLCRITLRQGDQLDNHDIPSVDLDSIRHDWRCVPDSYLEQYHWGVCHLDPDSWRFYLPVLLSYSVRHPQEDGSLVLAACLNTLRPPDREPTRFKSLSESQRRVICRALEYLAFDDVSRVQPDACQVLEEYWVPGSLYGNT